jgi:AmmeMemoRadiSam system radical SAM enzyme/AmmeMemoRadiSam system protein B/AmmeMemoRadiSam system protein A
MVLTTYGRSTGFCIDPIEKKPLNHFYPGTSVLSFGTAGCNLACKFCQNWSISKSREIRQLSEEATPDMIARAAQQLGCRSVAFTYNDPVIWAEYAMDTARACRGLGIKTVAVTAGYISAGARRPFFELMDAANVDLKAFTEEFYQQLTLSHLQPVLDTLVWLRRESDVWFEVTNLVIPDANDDDQEFQRMLDWILEQLGDDVPLHFTAFHPDFRLQDRPVTPQETLLRAYELARRAGVKHVYVGNVNDVRHQSTYCPSCGGCVIERNWYELGAYQLDGNHCRGCGQAIAGRFDRGGGPGNWGRKRQPVRIAQFRSGEESASQRESTGELQRASKLVELPVLTSAATLAVPSTALSNALSTSPAIGLPADRCQSTQSSGDDAMSNSSQPARGAAQPASSHLASTTDVPAPELTALQEAALLQAASHVVAASVCGGPVKLSDPQLAGAADVPVFGCFVSIKRRGRLRGCCGFLGRRELLWPAMAESARTSAIADARLPRIVPEELPFLDFEIWLLHSQRAVRQEGDQRREAVEIGRHGLQIQRGDARGLLLPGVASDHQLDAEGFLHQVCLKAGLSPGAWREPGTQLATFEGRVVRGRLDAGLLETLGLSTTPAARFTAQEIAALTAFCRDNIVAHARGATPNYYLAGASDANVHGLSLRVMLANHDAPLGFDRFTLRNPVPLQATLFQWCEAAGARLRDEGMGNLAPQHVRVELAVMLDPAPQGTLSAPDLDGLRTESRGLAVHFGNRSAWQFDAHQQPSQLLQAVQQAAGLTGQNEAVLHSARVFASRNPWQVVQVPQASRGGEVRPPAVAGKFYPAEPQRLDQMLDELTPAEPVVTETWRAAMIPHAGLIYSGRIAADVLRRVAVPETVVVIGPKHTRQGVDFAVAPHRRWLLPGRTVDSDVELAAALADAVDQWQLDAAAHQREHAIEVELPWLARFAPHTKVVGVAIGHADYAKCERFAERLADVLRDRLDRTLLVISTDMNHFASDTETRRVDTLALEAIRSLDAERLYGTVRDQHISMCGVLPACIVLGTLRRLDQLSVCQQVAYGTSADVSGDPSRVVGYAGMLFR